MDSMGKVQTLRPRLASIGLMRVGTITTATQRMTGRRLQKRNEAFKRAHPLCAHCAEQGRTTAVAEVDHVIPLHQGGLDVEGNLQGLCIPCHEAKSAREAAERGVGGANLYDLSAGNRRPSHAEKKSPFQMDSNGRG